MSIKKKIPDVFVIVFTLIILAAVATWIVPGGSYERVSEEVGGVTRQVPVVGSFTFEKSHPQFLEIFTAPMQGFLRLAEIVAFIFLVGGAFYILNETGAIAAGTHQLVRKLKGREILIIPIVMTFFSLFGAVFGMCEEAMPFVLIFVPLALSLGYDSFVGISLSFLAAGVGFAGAFLNPFTLQIAQGLAGVPLVSGWEYRIVVWVIVTASTTAWIMIYAARIRKDPTRSPMYDLDTKRREEILRQQSEQGAFTRRHVMSLLVLLAGVVGMIVGVSVFGWYITELSALFLAMGVVSGIVAGQSPNTLAKNFILGVKDMASAALVVAFAGGILIVLENGNIMDTILYGLSSMTSNLPRMLSADAMYVMQMALNFFIPSGSTKAALTMPLMGPLADLSGLTRQTAVLAYQLGDGFTNMIIPTSGVTIGTLAMAKIPYERWFKWHLPMQVYFFILSLLLLIWPVLAHWQ
ncbi:MAG: putative basic amino acid antiporter YfcC [Bacteroidetes bacterium]|nr:putative basic amino acid antiporter YfcC [Bacteroidota bacterium]